MAYLGKDDFVKRVARKSNMTISEAQRLLEIIGDVGIEALQEGHEFTFPGIGRIKTTVRRARRGRNPKTNEQLHIPGKTSARLSPSVGLLRALNNHGQHAAASSSAAD